MAKAEKKPAATSEGAAVAAPALESPSLVDKKKEIRKLMAETGISLLEATARIEKPELFKEPEPEKEEKKEAEQKEPDQPAS